MGAMNVSFSDGGDPYLLRARRMLSAAFLGSAAILIGGLVGRSDPLAIITIALWAAVAGLLVAIDSAAADIGVLTLVMLVIFSGQHMSPSTAIRAGAFALLGGLFQTALAVILWPVRRYEPERRVLGTLFRGLSRTTSAPVDATVAPPVSRAVSDARNMLSRLWRTHSIEGERYLLLLAQAERIRLSVLLLARLRTRTRKEGSSVWAAAVVDECLSAAATVLDAIASSLDRRQDSKRPVPESLRAVQGTAERLRESVEAPGVAEEMPGTRLTHSQASFDPPSNWRFH
jgi:hypothetical protein